jgi:hypothetical protein
MAEFDKVKAGRYRHWKGNTYEVLGEAVHTETGERVVVYRPVMRTPRTPIWVRPAENFKQAVVDDHGKPVLRFLYVGGGEEVKR